MVTAKADLVLRGGNVFLGRGAGFAESVAIWGGRVIAHGTDSEIDALVGTGTRIVDLRGRLAAPGLNDAHQHLLMVGLGLSEVDCKTDTQMQALLAKIKARAEKAKPGEWIFGRGYDHFELDAKRHPFREELDQVAPNNPVYVKRTCGHMGVANSAALKLAGIDEGTPQPEGGHIESQNGKLTGLLQERAQEMITAVLSDHSIEALAEGVRAGQQHNLSLGFTSVTDPGVGLRQGYDEWKAYQQLKRQGGFGLRMHLMMLAGASGWPDRAIDLGLMTGDGDEWLRVGPMKLFTDGSAGGKTAAMFDPYVGEPENTGIMIYEDQQLFDYVKDYHDRGYQVATHAIGDRAIEQVLTAYELAIGNDVEAQGNRRHRIEHCGFLSPEQLARMKRVGVLPAPQSIFMYEFGDLYVDVLGEQMAAKAYPFRSFLDAGVYPSASSDAPVSSTNPFQNIYSMITRKTKRGTELGPDQRLTLEEALHCYSYCGAYGSFEEDIKGTLGPGQLGDVTVFDRDLFAVEPEEILEASADFAIVGGEIMHDRLGEAA
ncbi:amidohydrolase [Nisaea acidiphila]|uniref:Amidohydrolase n=1 Tax=Nisaea acidiphila TaxID=1862145 RepID=A0A9J7ATD0_9PROT|nr:amidohydrolase [Nisaea acidiphila]UUX49737.1 amidohydrolase [Nisaea acidiphila]